MGHNLHYLIDTGVTEVIIVIQVFIGRYCCSSGPCILLYLLASRPHGLLVIEHPTNPASGMSYRLKLCLFLWLIHGPRQCILGVISPWPLAICVITILTSIHYRFALQRKALGIIRLDGLIKIVSIISFILPMPQGMTGMVSMTPNPAYIMWDWYSFMFSAISLALVMMWILSA